MSPPGSANEVETAIANARLTISVLLFLMLAGTMAYISIPKEAEPDIQIPDPLRLHAL